MTKNTYYDVIVIGTGASGMAAAVSAAEEGLSVLQLEAGKKAGGSSNYTVGMLGINSKVQQKLGIKLDIAQMLQQALDFSNYRANTNILVPYFKKSGKIIDWLSDLGITFDGAGTDGAGVPVMHFIHGGGKAMINECLLPKAEELGAKIIYNTTVDGILTDDKNKICGVHATQNDGTQLEFYAKNVIIASGGFVNNRKMMKKYATSYDLDRLLILNSNTTNGKAMQAAWDIGAQQYGTGLLNLAGGAIIDHGEPAYKYITSHLFVGFFGQPFLWVNEFGHRFVNEEVVFRESEAGNALFSQAKAFSILSKNNIDYLAKNGCLKMVLYTPEGTKLVKLQSEIDTALKNNKSFIHKGNSIAELAKSMHVPESQLEKTISTYNKACQAHKDENYFKNPKYLQPVTEGPYYAVEMGVTTSNTFGGIKVTSDNVVINNDNQLISNLYAVGNDAGGLHGDTYNHLIGGEALGYAVFSGYNAGKHIAKANKIQKH